MTIGEGSRDPDSKERFRARWWGVEGTELDCAELDVGCWVWVARCAGRDGRGWARSGCCLGGILWGVSLSFPLVMPSRSGLSVFFGPLVPWQLCVAGDCLVARLSLLDTLEEDLDRGGAAWMIGTGSTLCRGGDCNPPPPLPGEMSLLYCKSCAWCWETNNGNRSYAGGG